MAAQTITLESLKDMLEELVQGQKHMQATLDRHTKTLEDSQRRRHGLARARIIDNRRPPDGELRLPFSQGISSPAVLGRDQVMDAGALQTEPDLVAVPPTRCSTLGPGFDAGCNTAEVPSLLPQVTAAAIPASPEASWTSTSLSSAALKLSTPTPTTCSTKCFHTGTDVQKSAVDDVFTSVGGLSIFLEFNIGSDEEVLEEVLYKDMMWDEFISDPILTYVGGVSLFLEKGLDFADEVFEEVLPEDVSLPYEVLTYVGGLSLFLEFARDLSVASANEVWHDKPPWFCTAFSPGNIAQQPEWCTSFEYIPTATRLQERWVYQLELNGDSVHIMKILDELDTSSSWLSSSTEHMYILVNVLSRSISLAPHSPDSSLEAVTNSAARLWDPGIFQVGFLANLQLLDCYSMPYIFVTAIPWIGSCTHDGFHPGINGLDGPFFVFGTIQSWRQNAFSPGCNSMQSLHFVMDKWPPSNRSGFSHGQRWSGSCCSHIFRSDFRLLFQSVDHGVSLLLLWDPGDAVGMPVTATFLQVPWDPGGMHSRSLRASRVSRGRECNTRICWEPGSVDIGPWAMWTWTGSWTCNYKGQASSAREGDRTELKKLRCLLLLPTVWSFSTSGSPGWLFSTNSPIDLTSGDAVTTGHYSLPHFLLCPMVHYCFIKCIIHLL